MRIRTVHHVNIVVDDVDAATHFYTEVLGLPVIDDRGPSPRPGGHFAVGDCQIHLTLGVPSPPNGQHFTLEVDDFEATIEELKRAGIDVARSERRTQITVSDPSGNQIEIRAW